MNLAILGNDQLSQFVANAIKQTYNPFLIQQNKEPINIIAFLIESNQGGGICFVQ